METNLAPETPALEPQAVAAPAPVAPWWHTLSIVAVLLFFSAKGAVSPHRETTSQMKLIQYGVTMAWQWLLFGYIWWGIRKRGTSMRELIGGKWREVEDVLLDVVFAVAGLFAWLIAMVIIAKLFHMVDPGQVSHKIEETRKLVGFLVPHTRVELAFFVALSCTAGVCEEVLFRGYFMRQLLSLRMGAAAAIIGQGVVFGLAHGYQGAQKMLLIALLGTFFGVVAYFRKSLRPTIIAHSSFDIIQGLLMRIILK